jgi:CheY-like chemotaxis protein
VLVCVVDDESVGRSLSRLFRSARLPAETFASAQAYLDRATHDGMQLPGLDGLELQHSIAEREEQIVFIAGHGDVPACTQAMKAGAVDFLTKPVDDNLGAFRTIESAEPFTINGTSRVAASRLAKPPSARYSLSPAIPMNRLAVIFDRWLLQVGLTACSSTSVSQSRTDAVQNRQDWMNSPAEAVAKRRQIRSDNKDARIAATFDAM